MKNGARWCCFVLPMSYMLKTRVGSNERAVYLYRL